MTSFDKSMQASTTSISVKGSKDEKGGGRGGGGGEGIVIPFHAHILTKFTCHVQLKQQIK